MKTLLVLFGLAISLACPIAGAQTDFPSKPIRLFVGFPPGGSTDVLARALSLEVRKSLGQELMVINKPGATGVISVNEVMASSADGYTLGITPNTTLTLAPFVQNVRPDLIESTSSLASVGRMRIGLLVKADSPFRSVKDLIAHARKNPGKVSIGSPGAGTKVDTIMRAIGTQEKVEINFAPFQGDAPVATAILGGHISAGAYSAGGWGTHVRAGTMRLLASMEEERIDYAPEAPTLIEQGYRYSGGSIVYVFGPKGLAGPVAKRLTDALTEASRSSAYADLAGKFGMDSKNLLSGEALVRALLKDRADNGAMLENLGLKKKQ